MLSQTVGFQHLSIEDGLSQGMIFDLAQTRDGFLWIATKDGLNRYDGYNFKVFSNNPFNPYSLSENTVTALFEDSHGRLWLGFQNKGVDVYDPVTGRFHHFPLEFGENKRPWAGYIEDIIETPETNTIWALANSGLVRFSLPPEWKEGLPQTPNLALVSPPELVALPAPPNPIHADKQEVFKSLALRPNGELMVVSEKMIYVVDPKTGNASLLENFHPEKLLIRAALTGNQDSETIWLYRNSDKANNPDSDLVRLRNGHQEVFPFPKDLHPFWKRLLPGREGHLWMVIGRKLWNLAPHEIPDFTKHDLEFDAIPTTLLYDRNGNLWLGTIGYGLRKVSHLQGVFHAGAADWTLDGVWAHKGRYFVKWVNEIRTYDPHSGLLSNHSAFPDAPVLQVALAFEPSGATWLLAASEDKPARQLLLRYAPGSTGPAERVFEFKAQINLMDPFLRTADGRLWIATQGCKLIRFDPATERFDYFDAGYLFGEEAGTVRPVALAEDEEGIVWLGTILGLVKCIPSAQNVDFQLIQAIPSNPEGLNNNSIACILPDPNGLLWLGTKGGGINVMDARTGKCQHINTENGLLNNVVYGILPATPEKGKSNAEFWCSTNRGLAKITVRQRNPFTFTVTTYTADLGLQDNEFNTQSYYRADNGELLFGGINGLNRFFPEQVKMDTSLPPVFIVGLEINHQKAAFGSPGSLLQQPLENLRELRLHHDQNNLSFEFAALDFTDPSKNRYRYRLTGMDDDWVETGNLRFAHFNHLPPGRYEFRVQGSNGESTWADARSITVIVMPPWWRSKLAYFCYLLLLAWAGWRAYKLQIQRVKEREQLAFEQRETERVRALEQVKTNFFNNVTHELRTPLTLIIEPLRQLLKNPDDSDLSEKIRLVEKNSQRLLGLVNQLLDMAKLEGGSMTLDLRRGDFGQTVRGVFESFLHLAAQRNVRLILLMPDSIPSLDFDKDKVEIVLNNLISNALKFTPDGGHIQLDMGLKVFSDGLYTEAFVAVKDTGIGIPTEALEKIFDRFYQVDGSHTQVGEGTGIGLALSKELAKLMGGNITVESKTGEGSTFTFWFPVKTASGFISDLHVPENAFEKSKPARPANGEKPVVLVVEDNMELRKFISQSVGIAWQVVEASNGEEGVKKAIELLPDLVISDVMMPVKSGYELCDELKTNELTAHVPVILLTAKSAIESKLKGLSNGADDYLTKPFNTGELLARMKNLVELRRKLRELYSRQPVTTAGEAGDNLSAPDREFLRKFNSLLEKHLSDETLGVEDFSQKMFLSRSQLHRKLKAVTGRSATDFIRDYRLEQAYALLQQGGLLVGEVAMRVGFGNEKYFSTVFKEKYGVPPSQIMQR